MSVRRGTGRFAGLLAAFALAGGVALAQEAEGEATQEAPAIDAPAEGFSPEPPAAQEPVTLESALADPVGASGDTAYGAYQRGLFLTAFLRATERLESDPTDAAAMTLLGELHAQGLGIAQDLRKAAEWYSLAARRGDANAAFALGSLTLAGEGVARDPQAARALFEQAAEGGHPAASYNLALVLLDEGGPAEVERAARLLERAAEAEIPDAQHALGVLHGRGHGVAEDHALAADLFRRAAYNGSLAGMVEYAIALFNGVGVARDEAAAADYFRQAAYRGNAIAQNRLARLYAAGRGVEQDLVEAAAWHMMAASQGLADSWLDEALSDLPEEADIEAERLARERLDQ